MPVSREEFETYLSQDEMKVERLVRRKNVEAEETKKILEMLKDQAMTTKEVADEFQCEHHRAYEQLSSMLHRGLLLRRYDKVNLQAHWIAVGGEKCAVEN